MSSKLTMRMLHDINLYGSSTGYNGMWKPKHYNACCALLVLLDLFNLDRAETREIGRWAHNRVDWMKQTSPLSKP